MSKDKTISLPKEKAFIAYRFDTRSFEEIADSGGFIDRFEIDEHVFIKDKYIDAGYLYEGESTISEKFAHILSNNLPSNAGAHLGGISVCLNPLGRMFNMQQNEIIYLHVISIGGEIVPVSPLYQTQDDYRRLINYVYYEQIQKDTIISSFDQSGNEILSLKLDIDGRERTDVNIVIKREEGRIFACSFKIRNSEKKPVLHNQNGKMVGFLETSIDSTKNIIDYFGNKIGHYCQEKNLAFLSHKNIFLKDCQIKEIRVYKNNSVSFDDHSFKEILINSNISQKSQKYLAENYNCQKLEELINKNKIISKNNVYEFEFSLPDDLEIQNIAMSLKIKILSGRKFLIGDIEINEKFSPGKKHICYDRFFEKILRNLKSLNMEVEIAEQDTDSCLIQELMTRISERHLLERSSNVKDSQEFKKKLKEIEKTYLNPSFLDKHKYQKKSEEEFVNILKKITTKSTNKKGVISEFLPKQVQTLPLRLFSVVSRREGEIEIICMGERNFESSELALDLRKTSANMVEKISNFSQKLLRNLARFFEYSPSIKYIPQLTEFSLSYRLKQVSAEDVKSQFQNNYGRN